jgi:membrane fusion protein (multidrug efflux system)
LQLCREGLVFVADRVAVSWRWLAAFGVAALIVASAAWWLIDRSAAVYTSDARVRANMVSVSADVTGRIIEILVKPGDRVAAGAMLARLDDSKAKLALAAASLELKAIEAEIEREKLRAELAQTKGSNRVDASEAELSAARSDVDASRAMLATAEAEYERFRTLKDKGLATRSAFDQAAMRLEAARQAVGRASAAVGKGKAGIGEALAEAGEQHVIERNINVLSLRAHALRQQISLQKVALDQHVIESPLAGVIDEVFADKGEYIVTGARLALAHDPADLWIEANVKETDIARIRVGASAEARLDASPGRACAGRVERIGSAATAEFALIPNANPTGVFTKITQRVPVRVSLEGPCAQLRPGAMASLRIVTHDAAR